MQEYPVRAKRVVVSEELIDRFCGFLLGYEARHRSAELRLDDSGDAPRGILDFRRSRASGDSVAASAEPEAV